MCNYFLDLDWTTRDIGLYVNENKTDLMYFKKERAISTLRSRPLKLEEQFSYLDCKISSIESDVNIHMNCYWQVGDQMEIWSLIK